MVLCVRPSYGFKMESTLDIGKIRCYYNYGKQTLHFLTGGDILKNRLEQIRKDFGITQEELAEKLEVSRQTIGSLENGRYNPSILLAFKIAKLFNLRIEEIFIYEEDIENEKK